MGEDVLLDVLFKDKPSGFFVEIGCIDGKRFSNSLTFEERGWNGLCIEAHAGYIDLLKRNRPNSIVVHCAVGEADEDNVPFFANSRGSLSTLDHSLETHFKEQFADFFTGFEEQHVNKRQLDTLFREHKISDIDFISLDIEGYEIEALKGLSLHKYRPRAFVVEADTKDQEARLDHILLSSGYIKSVSIGSNIFYVIDASLHKRIKGKVFHAQLIHTQHPLDDGQDELVSVQIKTKRSLFDKLSFIKKRLSTWLELKG
jgi:FkbM family methyltransferase